MNFKKSAGLAIALWLSASFTINAQKQTLTGITNLRASAISPIYDQNEVKGYMLYYKSDKADKKNDNYGLDIFDENLSKVKSITMQKPRKSYFLLRNAYNGTAFSFYFYNYRDRELEIETYDRSLNKIATHKISELSKMDKIYIEQELQKGTTGDNNMMTGMNLFPVPNKGFVRNNYEGLGKGFGLEMYDNKLNLKWSYKPEAKSKNYEAISISEVTDQYLMATIIRRNNLFSKDLNVFITAFDIETGKKVMDLPLETKSGEQLSLSSMSFDVQKQEFIVLGEYYNADDQPFVNKSQGFFIKRVGLDGKERSTKLNGWNKEVKSILPAEARKSVEENYINYIHKVLKGSNGNMYIVAEQYKIVASGSGIALKALGGNASTMKGKIGNIMIFAIDPADILKEIKFYQKEVTDFALPPGLGWYGAGLLGNVIRVEGGFDFQFTQSSADDKNFSVAYLDFAKKSKTSNTSLVNVMFDYDNIFNTDNIDITPNKKSKSLTYPGKTGYNMIVDYSAEEKAMEMRLVKLNR
jgi:hypothetical protein